MASASNFDSGLDLMPVNKPPFFNGANYAYWKNRMMYFIQASDMGAWNAVEEGYIKPLTHPRLWSEGETRMFQLNSKAIHIIFCALGPYEYGRVSSCTTAKEIWDKLQFTHEGTDEVKKSKISILTHSYENFRMKPNEDIKAMTDRFSTIVNGLKSYGEIISNEKLVRKLVYSLPKSWQSKKTAIIESKDLTSLTLEELIGSLLTHEMMLEDEVDLNKIDETPKEKEKKKNIGVALKSTKDESDSNNDDDDEEMALFAKRFRKMMRPYRGRKFKRNEGLKNEPKEKDPIICYECKKPGHVKYDCPQLKKKGQSKNKHKAHVATWSDEESSDEEEQEVANLCLMAFGEDSKWMLKTHDRRQKPVHEINAKNGGEVTFGDNSKGHIEGIGTIVAKDEHDSWLWHRRLGHASMSVLQRLIQGVINTNDVRHEVGEPSSKEETKNEETHDPLENPTIEEREVSYPREYNYVKDGEIIGDPSKGLMQSEFEMDDGGALIFLGTPNQANKRCIFINQAKYVKDMLKKFGLENGKPHDTPMSSSTKLDLDEEGKSVDVKLYRFQSCPKESHLLAVKRIFRYLKDTPSLGLWYPRDSSFSLHAFSDTDYGGCKLDRKSTSDFSILVQRESIPPVREPIPPLKGNRFPPGESIPPWGSVKIGQNTPKFPKPFFYLQAISHPQTLKSPFLPQIIDFNRNSLQISSPKLAIIIKIVQTTSKSPQSSSFKVIQSIFFTMSNPKRARYSSSRSSRQPNPPPNPPPIPQNPIPNLDPNLTIQNSCFNQPGPKDYRYWFFQYFDSYKIREERIPSLQAMVSINFKYLPILHEWKFDKLFELEPVVYHQLVRIFYCNAVCIKNRDKTKTIGVRSYLLGQYFHLDPAYIANALGLDNEAKLRVGLDASFPLMKQINLLSLTRAGWVKNKETDEWVRSSTTTLGASSSQAPLEADEDPEFEQLMRDIDETEDEPEQPEEHAQQSTQMPPYFQSFMETFDFRYATMDSRFTSIESHLSTMGAQQLEILREIRANNETTNHVLMTSLTKWPLCELVFLLLIRICD
ncbi:hypothetical protein F3Y22_tig00111458pilonHSYRG00129 [Hibiscus syriacus]|uniref:CCHC-type domain-containing protein n=1 Tax=Hibiscus syriacus TaxID=106335 RepID=A0A6A2YJY4_HIBSY|nr:hypothetical protein F3Y22_tig00111458pilonHSYRG00129 [Hibiscus syriacus]